MADLIYIKKGMFTTFIAQTNAGEEAWKEIYKVTGDGAVRNDHLKQTLKQLRKAGYAVTKSKKCTKEEVDNVLSELESILGI